MSRAKILLEKLLEAEKWTSKVKVKHHPPEGLFANGSPQDIAKWAKEVHNDLQSAMASLNFFLNRMGKKATKELKDKVEKAKELLRKMFKKEEK